jgi:type IX secretion system PorP/SprF family membrane protein
LVLFHGRLDVNMKNFKLISFIGAFLILSGSLSYGQQDAQFSQYMFNSVYYNPAFAGIDGLTRGTAIYRHQYLGYNAYQNGGGAPQSFVLTGSTLTPLLNKKIGLGINFLQDQIGPLTTTQAQVAASYLFKIKNGTLGAGIRVGLIGMRNKGDYRVYDPNDNIYQQLQNGGLSQMKPDVSLGLVYRTTKYYFGISLAHVLNNEFTYGLSSDTGGTAALKSQLMNHMYITGGYNLNIGSMIVLTPSALIQTDIKQLTMVYGAIATYNDKVWVGLNARQSFAKRDVNVGGKSLNNDDIIFLVGLNLLKNKQNNNSLKIGYAFDFVTSGVKAKKNTSHEIMLSYLIVPPWEIRKPKVRTPRYRQDEN